MMRAGALIAGLAVLALLWGGPLSALSSHRFSAHMALHMGVVAVAAPFLAISLSGRWRSPLSPLAAAMIEFAVVWIWHAPALHGAARQTGGIFMLEQASFLGAGLLLWLACLGPGRERSLLGALALLLTSMHMTLLGALLAFAGRPLYGHAGHDGAIADRLADQQMGAVIMLLIGGAIYLAGGVVLTARVVLAPIGGERTE